MKFKYVLLGAAAALIASGATGQISGKSPLDLAVAAGASAPPAGWTAPRTAWGDPDLRGIWPIDSVGRTPVERPVELGTKAYLTDEEYAAALALAESTAANYEREDGAGQRSHSAAHGRRRAALRPHAQQLERHPVRPDQRFQHARPLPQLWLAIVDD